MFLILSIDGIEKRVWPLNPPSKFKASATEKEIHEAKQEYYNAAKEFALLDAKDIIRGKAYDLYIQVKAYIQPADVVLTPEEKQLEKEAELKKVDHVRFKHITWLKPDAPAEPRPEAVYSNHSPLRVAQ